MNASQILTPLKQIVLAVGIVFAVVAALKVLGVSIPAVRAGLTELAAVSAACVFAGR